MAGRNPAIRRKQTDAGLQDHPQNNHEFRWVSCSTLNPQSHSISVKGSNNVIKRVSRQLKGHYFVGGFVESEENGENAGDLEVLTDPTGKLMWMAFTKDFDPETLGAVIANDTCDHQPNIFIGKVMRKDGSVDIGTIRSEANGYQLYSGNPEEKIDLEDTDISCEVLCEK